MEKVFVYGILVGREDAMSAELFGYEKFYRGHATIKKNLKEVVDGELIEVDGATLKRFDEIEGVAVGYYYRFKVEVMDENMQPHTAWVYQQCEDKDE